MKAMLVGVYLVAVSTLARPELAPAQCVGDCNGDGRVTVAELVTGVAIALENSPVASRLRPSLP